MAWVAALVLVAGAAQAQRPARPRPLAQSLPPDAKRDYEAGRLLFEDGDFATALLKYQAAYDTTHDVRLLWDVAVCQKSLRRYARSLATLARYLAEGADALTAADRRDAQELSRAIAPFTSAQTLRVSEDGAQIAIDERVVGESPVSTPIVLDIGTHHVRVTKDGFRAWDREVPVGGSAPTSVEIVLARASGHLELRTPPDAAVRIDDRDVGPGPSLSLDLAAGPHVLHVTAPHRRPFATDLLIEDGKSRSVGVELERESAPSSEVHVTVGCARPEPMPQDSLSVFFDDATESALPLGVRMRREPGHDVIAYVPYRVAPGHHTVHVAALGCDSRDTEVDAPEGGVAAVTGALPPSDTWFDGSPAGSHDGWRLSGGPELETLSFSCYEHFFPASGAGCSQNPVGLVLYGLSVAAGLEGRWTTALIDASGVSGRISGDVGGTRSPATVSEWKLGVRPGLRLPLYVAALSAGFGFHLGQYFFAPDAGSSRSGSLSSASLWAAADIQPFCEFALQIGAATSTDAYNDLPQGGAGPSAVATLWLHAAFAPNTVCNRKQSGQFKIQGNIR